MTTIDKPTDQEVRSLVQKLWRLQRGESTAELVMSDLEWALAVSLYRRGWNDCANAMEVAHG